jgi:deoxyribodipyrimidine photo-lyase
MHGIVWFRRDLRLHDNPALEAACHACSHVIPLFVFDEPLLRSQTFGSACVNFMLGCLEDLAASLAARGVFLQWRRGEPVEEVVNAARDAKAEIVYWNRDYEPGAIQRDCAVQERLAELGVRAQTFKDHVVFEAEEVRGATGEPFQRYSAYRARWWSRWQASHPPVLPLPVRLCAEKSVPFSAPCPIPTARELGYDRLAPWIEPGEQNARKALLRFLGQPIHRYAEDRNLPAIDGTSKLSPHFRFGTLSPRTAIHAALAALAAGGRVSRADVLAWVDEIIWREFFQQVLSAFPRVVDGPFRASAAPTREAGPERDRLFQAWCDGKTGYPIVDAGMRQLNETGWMHNRVRMIAASFLIKDLRIDWQSGERYFMRHLLDADTAANNGNWQWCASTGTDAMRGYRIFNPAVQSKKFDLDGAYIRRYVPELKTVASAWVHEPHLMTLDDQARSGCRIGADYPAPIVDHRRARLEYLRLSERQVTR